MPERRNIEAMARDVFELTKMSWMMSQRIRVEGIGELSDQEFLTLDVLQQRGPMIVGDLQRYLGVLPGQMSRIIRAMENRRPALVQCAINPQDRRKVDVTLTDAGRQAVDGYRDTKLQRTRAALAELDPADRTDFMRILDTMRNNLRRRMQQADPP